MSDKKRIVIVFVIGLVIIATGFFLVSRNEKAYTTSMFAMDTACTITFYGNDDFSAVKNEITELEKVISAYDENSEIYNLNKNSGGTVSKNAKDLLKQSLSLYDLYGSVNPCIGGVIKLWNVEGENPVVPQEREIQKALSTVDSENVSVDNTGIYTLKNGVQLDFGATGKGFALDKVNEVLTSQGTKCAVISFGSSSLLYGERADKKPFTIAVSNPDDDNETVLTFESDSGFVSTSGGYERFFTAEGKTYSHIFDETTGKPADTDLTSVTVKCDSGIKSDFLSTCIYINGTSQLDKWLSDTSIQIIAIDKSKNVYCSKSLSDSIQITNENFLLV